MLVVFEVSVGSLALVVALISLLLHLCWCGSRRGPNPTEHDMQRLCSTSQSDRRSMSQSDLSSGLWSGVDLCNRVDVPIQPVVV